MVLSSSELRDNLEGLPKGWKIVLLRNIISKSFGGGTPSSKHKEFWDGDIPWTTSAIIKSDSIYLDNYQRKITEDGLKKSSSRIAPKGSILFGSRVGVGKVVITAIDMAISQDITALLLKENVNPEYLVYYIKTSQIQKIINEKKRGSTIKGIHRNDILDLPIVLPSFPEQQAIANVLRTVQYTKEKSEEVIRATKELKKVLFKHVFTYGPINTLDFERVQHKDTEVGTIPGDWEVCRLGEVADIEYGLQAAVANSTNPSGGIPILTNINIQIDGRLDLTTLRYFPVPQKKRDRLILRKGDLLFNWRSGSQKHVGKTAIFNLDGEYTFSSFILRFRANHINNQFLYYFLMKIKDDGFFERNRQQSSVNSVFNASISSKIPIPVPQKEIQEKIVRLLSSIDEKIAAEESYKESLDILLTTLLHDLMTAKVRIKDFERGQTINSSS